MKKHPQSRQGSWLSLCGSLLSRTLIAACILSPISGFSQLGGTNSQFYRLSGPLLSPYENYSDAKGFSTEAIRGTTESVMAGTLYDPNSQWGIPYFVHFLDGAMANTNPPGGAYPDPMGNTDVVIFPSPDFYHQRVVDIAVGENNMTSEACFITVSAREDALLSGARRDQIRVIQTDYSGASSGPDILIYDIQNINATKGYSLYPTHSLYKVVGSTKTLFICGYVTKDPTVGPSSGSFTPIPKGTSIALPYPDFTSDKEAFVLSINVGAAVPTLVACKYYNWGYWGGTTNPIEYDFDMAMHMTELSANYGQNTLCSLRQGHIHVTGSVTAKTGLYNGPNTPTVPMPYTIVRSATMNMSIDPANLSVDPFSNNPFISLGNGDGYGKSEYGVAFIEGDQFRHWDNYIISNVYDGYPSGGGPSSSYDYTTWAPSSYGGFNIKPEAFAITHTNQWGIGNAGTTNQRLRFPSGMWALQAIQNFNEDPTINFTNTQARYTIAGMMHSDPSSPTSMTLPPSDDNIIPFLFDIQTEFSGGSGANAGNTVRHANYPTALNFYGFDMVAYVNQTGTGIVGTNVNNYLTMGSDFSSVLWGPTFTSQYDNTQHFVMNAPKFGKKLASGGTGPFDFLGLKAFFAHKDDMDVAWGGCVEKMNPVATTEYVEGILGTAPYTGSSGMFTETDNYTNIFLHNPTAPSFNNAEYEKYGDCTGGHNSPSGNPVYRTAGGIRLQNAKTTIFPNPASDALHIQLASDIATDANVKIVLSTIQGQVVKELYNGTAEMLSAEYNMSLPAVASGLYVVQVYSNNKVVHQQKLSIQQ